MMKPPLSRIRVRKIANNSGDIMLIFNSGFGLFRLFNYYISCCRFYLIYLEKFVTVSTLAITNKVLCDRLYPCNLTNKVIMSSKEKLNKRSGKTNINQYNPIHSRTQ